jgi:putative FmdB family regulatory protein
MPTYEYSCEKCGEHLEVVQSFRDEPLTRCPACKGRLRKVFSPVGIVFKGSGFYKTDSRDTKRTKAASNGSEKSSSDSESSAASTDSGSGSSTERAGEKKENSKEKTSAKSKEKPTKTSAAAS